MWKSRRPSHDHQESKNGKTIPVDQKLEGNPPTHNAETGERPRATSPNDGEIVTAQKRLSKTYARSSVRETIYLGSECSLARPNPDPYWDLLTFEIAGQGFSVFPPSLPCRRPRGYFSLRS